MYCTSYQYFVAYPLRFRTALIRVGIEWISFRHSSWLILFDRCLAYWQLFSYCPVRQPIFRICQNNRTFLRCYIFTFTHNHTTSRLKLLQTVLRIKFLQLLNTISIRKPLLKMSTLKRNFSNNRQQNIARLPKNC
mgnify:CR=1 FL=1